MKDPKKKDAEKPEERNHDLFHIVAFFLTLAAYVWLLTVFYPGLWPELWRLVSSAVTLRPYREGGFFDTDVSGVLFGFVYTILCVALSVGIHAFVKKVTGFDKDEKKKWVGRLVIALGVACILVVPIVLTGRVIVTSGGEPIGGGQGWLYVMESWIFVIILIFALYLPPVIMGGIFFSKDFHDFFRAALLFLGVVAIVLGLPALVCYLLYTKVIIWPVHAPYWAQALFFAVLCVPLKIGTEASTRYNELLKTTPFLLACCLLIMAFNVLVFQYAIVLERPLGMIVGILWVWPMLRSLHGLNGELRRYKDTKYLGNNMKEVSYSVLGRDESIGVSYFWVSLFTVLFLVATVINP